MPVMRNNQVGAMWVKGQSARNGRNSMHTDGLSLYSYDMLIGITTADGAKVILNLYSPFRVSTTTTRHVSAARCAGVKMIDPVRTDYEHFTYFRSYYTFPAELLSVRRTF